MTPQKIVEHLQTFYLSAGPKQQKKFKRLMLHRIKWGEKSKRGKNVEDDEGTYSRH